MFELANTDCAWSIYLLWGRILISTEKGAMRLTERVTFRFDLYGVD